MKKNSFILLLFVLICSSLFAQQNTFIRTYNLSGMHGGLALAVMEDGGFVGTGQHSENGSTCKIYVYRIDECGNIIWFNLYGSGSGGGVSIDATSDEGVVIAADGSKIIKIDASGNPEWERNYSICSGYMTSVIQTSDDGYFAGGQTGILLKLDNQGDIIWSADISGNYVHALDEFPNGDLMYFSWDGSTIWLGRVTSNGVLVWEREYYSGSSSSDGHNTWGGEALVDTERERIIVASNHNSASGGVLVSSFDYNGNLVAMNSFGSSGSDFVRSIDIADDGGYIIGGGSYGLNTSANNVTQTAGVTPESLSGRDILLFKIDTNINFQWASVIGGANSEKAIGVRTNKDNGYTISAYTDGSFFNADYFDPLFIKTDSLGRVGCQQYSPVLTQMPYTTTINSTSSFILVSSNSTQISSTFTSINPSDYYMCLDCSTTPFFTISDTTLCVGDTTWFVNQSGGLICNQNWYVDGVIISGPADSVPFVFNSSGIHNIKLETTCGNNYVDYNLDFYVNNIKLYVTDTSEYNGYEISCFGNNDGFIETYATSPFPPVQYNWSTSNPAQSNQYNMTAGSYNLQLTDDYGCVFDTTFILVEPTQIISSYSVPILSTAGYNLLCSVDQNGSIDLTVSGSVPSSTVPYYSYQWSNGSQSEDLFNLSAGVYHYTVTDLNNCVTSDSVIITAPTLDIQQNINHVSCHNGIDGSISLSVSGSASPYYVFWDNNIDPSLLVAGSYSYQIIDSIGCVYLDTLIVNEPSPYVVSENISHVSCYGLNDGSISLSVSGSTPPYTIDWFGVSTNNMYAGTYNFTILDANQCPYSEIAIINQPNPIDVTFGISLPHCPYSNNGEIGTSIVGGISPYNENWFGFNPSSLTVGTYDYVVTDSNGCSDTSVLNLVSESDMYIVEESIDASCKGFCDGLTDLVVSNGISPYTINWLGVNPDSLCVGVHYYEIFDSLGCLYSDSVLITAPDSINASISQVGNLLTVNATGGVPPYSYNWFSQTNQLGTGDTLLVSGFGNYYCIAYDEQHCQSDTVVFLYSVSSLDNLYLSDLSIYPNPSKNIVNIEISSIDKIDLKVSIYDVFGRNIFYDFEENIKGMYSKQVNLSYYSKGVYLLKVDTGFGVIFKKIVHN